jgi:hypothetical protein
VARGGGRGDDLAHERVEVRRPGGRVRVGVGGGTSAAASGRAPARHHHWTGSGWARNDLTYLYFKNG